MALVAAGLGLAGTLAASSASSGAADAASEGAQASQIQQMQMMQQIQKMLKPYRQAGKQGLQGMLDLVGLGGADAQQSAINALEKSPQFTSLVKTGENAILQNASATGGLRGGNTQAALAEFRPQMLSNIIESQYAKLADLAGRGQNAAVNTGAGMQGYAMNIGNLMNQQGQIGADAAMAKGQNIQDLFGMFGNAYGQYLGKGMAGGTP